MRSHKHTDKKEKKKEKKKGKREERKKKMSKLPDEFPSTRKTFTIRRIGTAFLQGNLHARTCALY